ncbi:GntR family transcriptional regulator [Tabrizicola sp.]|uniref:GntR family transcriptional regulator n=1 Tax=Tabrizicola sp. TaxID=2005166 RepID=UPI003D298567
MARSAFVIGSAPLPRSPLPGASEHTRTEKTTLTEKAYDGLRQDIVTGALAPGQPLRMALLAQRYDMGFSPLREALNRLQAERLVISVALRGFSVAPLSIGEMWDATEARILIESQALRLSIRHGDDAWEAEIVGCLHALVLQATRAVSRPEKARALEQRHYAFHRALVAACGSAWLLEFFARLYLESERYRHPVLVPRSTGTSPKTPPEATQRDLQGEHDALAKAALTRDADLACTLLAEHYRRTAKHVEGLLAGEDMKTGSQQHDEPMR